jgi:hypothetical protein
MVEVETRPVSITLRWLKAEEACRSQVDLFRDTFGESADVSRAAATEAARAGLDVDWLAARLLDDPARRAYEEARATARRAYEEARAPARRAYEEARAPARRAYEEAMATARRAYDEAMAPARRAYDEATATTRRAYEEARATALCNLLGLM